jgi:hypothetical protein
MSAASKCTDIVFSLTASWHMACCALAARQPAAWLAGNHQQREEPTKLTKKQYNNTIQ